MVVILVKIHRVLLDYMLSAYWFIYTAYVIRNSISELI